MKVISIYPSSIARFLSVVALLLVLASIAGQFSTYVLADDQLKGLVRIFNVDKEENIPTLFSVLLILLSTLLLTIIAILQRKRRLPYVLHWAILASGFLVMAYDEAFQLHEKLVDPSRMLLGGNSLGVFYFAWIVPGIVLVLLIWLFFLKFLRHLTAETRLRFLIAGGLYIGGAIGFEAVGGFCVERMGVNNLTYNVIATIEESLEMGGLIVFIHALLKYCADNYKVLLFKFEA